MAAEVTPLRGDASVVPATVPAPTAQDVAAIAAALGQVDAANRRLRARLAHRLGLTVTDLTAIVVIGSDGCSPKQLALELGLTSGAVTAVIDRLVASQQATRAPRPGDRRSILVVLTERGEETLGTVAGLYVGAVAVALDASPHVFNRHILDSLRSTADALDGAAESGAAELGTAEHGAAGLGTAGLGTAGLGTPRAASA